MFSMFDNKKPHAPYKPSQYIWVEMDTQEKFLEHFKGQTMHRDEENNLYFELKPEIFSNKFNYRIYFTYDEDNDYYYQTFYILEKDHEYETQQARYLLELEQYQKDLFAYEENNKLIERTHQNREKINSLLGYGNIPLVDYLKNQEKIIALLEKREKNEVLLDR